jgi:non-ribosomal peptide synthetase component F
LFDEATISRMLVHFQNLLESFVSQPEQRLSEVRLLTTSEEKQLLEGLESNAG